MRHSLHVALFVLLTVRVTDAAAQQGPPVRPLGPVTATSAELLGAVSAVRALPGGRVLLNDVSARRVLLFDSTLASYRVIVDSITGSALAYGSRAGGLIAFRGDSSLFVDANALTMLVIDPAGNTGRVMAVPRPADANFLVGVDGNPAFDAKGRMVYRGLARAPRPATPPPPGSFVMPAGPDSAPVVRVDIATRAYDTVAMIRIPKTSFETKADEAGRVMIRGLFNPLPVTDDWAVMGDGSVALVRGGDYHVDWIGADGVASNSPKIPFQWRRLAEEEKGAFIDSTRAALEKVRADFMARAGLKDSVPAPGPRPPRAAPPAGVEIRSVSVLTAAAGDPSNWAPGRVPPPVLLVQPSELPDYAPPFGIRAARGDADGNLWIRTTMSSGGGPVYDIVNRKGELIDRVRIPAGRVIAGFGPGGVVYMGVREGTGVRLERARVR